MSPLKLSVLALIVYFAVSSVWAQEPSAQPTAPAVAQGSATAAPTITLDRETLRKLLQTGEAPEFWKTAVFWQIIAAFLGFAVATGLKYYFDIRRDDRNRKIEKETLVAELLGEIRTCHRGTKPLLSYAIYLANWMNENPTTKPDYKIFETFKLGPIPIFDNAIGRLGLLGPDGANNTIAYACEFRLTSNVIQIRSMYLKDNAISGGKDYVELSRWLMLLCIDLSYRERRLASIIKQESKLPLLPLDSDKLIDLYNKLYFYDGSNKELLEIHVTRFKMYKEGLKTEVYDPLIEAISNFIASQQT